MLEVAEVGFGIRLEEALSDLLFESDVVQEAVGQLMVGVYQVAGLDRLTPRSAPIGCRSASCAEPGPSTG